MGYRTAVVTVELQPADHRRAHEAHHLAGGLWNQAVAWVRAEWAAGRSPSKWDIQHFLTALPAGERPLHAHTTIAIAMDLYDAIATSRKNRKAGRKALAPWREKKYRPLSFTKGYGWRVKARRGRDMLYLSMGRGRAPLWLPLPEVTGTVTGRPVPPELWGEVRLCWDRDDRRHRLHIAYQCADVATGGPSVVAAIDEGIINPMTVAVPTSSGPGGVPTAFDVLVVNGREGRAAKRRRNKAVGQLSSRTSRAKPGSRRHRRLTASKKKVQGKASRVLRDFDHQVSAKAAGFIRSHGAGRVVVGDVRGIEQKTAERRRADKHLRQQLSQWSRGRQEAYLAHKTGLSVNHVPEPYTSQTCPACNARNRPKGRCYACRSCRFRCHRDAVGAVNIWRLAVLGAFVPLGPGLAIQATYRRAVPRWSKSQSGAHRKVERRAQQRAARALRSAPNRAGASDGAVVGALAPLPRPLPQRALAGLAAAAV